MVSKRTALLTLLLSIRPTASSTDAGGNDDGGGGDGGNDDRRLRSPPRAFHHPRPEPGSDATSGERSWLASASAAAAAAGGAGEVAGGPAGAAAEDAARSPRRRSGGERGGDADIAGCERTAPPVPVAASASASASAASVPVVVARDVLAEIDPIASPHGIGSGSPRPDRIDLARIRNSAERGEGASPGAPPSPDSAFLVGLFHVYGLVRPAGGGAERPDAPGPGRREDDEERAAGEAVRYLGMAASRDHSDAQCVLGILLYRGSPAVPGVGRDVAAAAGWFRRASDSGNARGRWLLGRAYYEGESGGGGVGGGGRGGGSARADGDGDGGREGPTGPDRLEEAARLFASAADGGIPEAFHHLALMYEYGLIRRPEDDDDGDGDAAPPDGGASSAASAAPSAPPSDARGRRDYRRAAELYGRASDAGYPESMYHLGLMRAYGRGMQQDRAIALDMFRRAAAVHSHAPSMRYVGISLANGYGAEDGTAADYGGALAWFERCAGSGDGSVSGLCEEDGRRLRDAMRRRAADRVWDTSKPRARGDDDTAVPFRG